jgi:hypothetical protein
VTQARTPNIVAIVAMLVAAFVSSVWADDSTAKDAADKAGLHAVPASAAAKSGALLPAQANAQITMTLDDGSAEDNLGVTQGDSGPSIQFIWFNRFTPNATDFPFNLNQIQVFFDGTANGASPGDAIDLVVYQDADANPANGAELLATYGTTVKVADGANWSVYDLNPPLRVSGPGDVLIGVINRFVETGVTPESYPAALDLDASQGRSWIGWWESADPPDPATLPSNAVFTDLDSAGYPGNWMIRGFGETIDWSSRSHLPLLVAGAGGCPAGTLSPNDPSFHLQWGMSKIDGPRAWFCGYQGDDDIVVAVIDTGVDMDHPEFAGKLVPGRDFANGDNWPDDDHGHGTNVAGIIGALGNNTTGVAGVAWYTSIMPLKTLRGDGFGYTSWSLSAVAFAVDNGAHIINMSLGGVDSSQAFQNAINDAYAEGILVIAAAGNCGDQYYGLNGCSYQDQPSYPGAYDHVVAVASTTSSDQQSSFSTQGAYVDIAAPGSYIYSTDADGGYRSMSGTSQATPHVAGLAALVKGAYPDLSPDQIADAMQDSAVDLGTAGKDIRFGWGRIDAPAALTLAARGFISASDGSVDLSVAQPMENRDAEIAPGVVLAKFRPGVSVQSLSDVLANVDPNIRVESSIEPFGIMKLSVPVGGEWSVVDALRADPQIEYAEPDTVLRIQ